MLQYAAVGSDVADEYVDATRLGPLSNVEAPILLVFIGKLYIAQIEEEYNRRSLFVAVVNYELREVEFVVRWCGVGHNDPPPRPPLRP